jgi:hypothetical protein
MTITRATEKASNLVAQAQRLVNDALHEKLLKLGIPIEELPMYEAVETSGNEWLIDYDGSLARTGIEVFVSDNLTLEDLKRLY